jgi:hypothetical protein
MGRTHVLAKLGERKNGQIQATLKTSTCALISCIKAFKNSQNNLVSESEQYFKLQLNSENYDRNKNYNNRLK